MSRHLLPKLKNDKLTRNDTGKWLDFSDDFQNFPPEIDVSNSEINITSIPSPWARMLLFKEAILDVDHVMHMEVMSDILDVLEIIYYQKNLNYSIKEFELDISSPDNKFFKILNSLNPDESFNKITLFLVLKDKQEFVLAGSSPYTLVFTPRDIKGKLDRYFKEEPVLLKDRPVEFQQYINCGFLANLRNHSNKKYGELVKALSFKDGIGRDSNKDKVAIGITKSEFGLKDDLLKGLFDQTDGSEIDSDLIMHPGRPKVKEKPLVIVTGSLKGRPYYNGYTFQNEYTTEALKDKPRDFLPGDGIKYPWVLPEVDFLQPVLFKYKYKLNNEFLVLGKKSNEYKFALPLTDLYFKYFTPEDADKYVSITHDNNLSVKVSLEIPLKNGKSITIKRDYSEASPINKLIEYDNKQEFTPLPYISIWPKLNPDNWNEQYYGLIYRKDAGEFSLQFIEENGNIIVPSISQKSNSVEIFRIEKLPTYVNIMHKEGYYGKLILDHKAFPYIKPIHEKASVGIDFGTSHTNVALQLNNDIEILRYNSDFEGDNLNTKDFIMCFEFADDELKDNLPLNLLPLINQYFFPNCLGVKNSDHSVNMPLPSMIINEGQGEIEALLRSSINFSKHKYFSYSEDGQPIRKTYDERADLKWSTDKYNQQSAQEYLKIILLLIKYELIQRKIDPDKATYLWAYPKSFSSTHVKGYETMWNDLIKRDTVYHDESKATLLFFNYKNMLAKRSPELSIIIDIGGGSSDISVWQDGKTHLLYSTLWAGKNLVGYREEDKTHSVIYTELVNEFSEIAGRYKDLKSFLTHLNFILSSVADNELLKLTQTDKFWLPRFNILYFYSALFYEIGLQCRRFVTDKTENINVCLAGNGARFVNWSSGRFGEISPFDIVIYEHVLKQSLNLPKQTGVKYVSSKDFKNEVAIGLCNGDEKLKGDANYQPVIGEEISKQDKVLSFNSTINEFDLEFNPKNQTQVDFMIDKNKSEIVRFHDVFFSVLGTSALYKEILSKNPKLNDLDTVKNYLLNDWDFVGKIRDTVFENEEKLKTLTCSIFIIGMQIIINRLHKYLSV